MMELTSGRTKEWWEQFWSNDKNDYGEPKQKLLRFAQDFRKGKDVPTAVDIASGNGRYAIPLAKMGYQADALELAESGIRRIKEFAKEEHVQVNVIQGDFVELCKERNRSYDLVLSSGLLEEIDKKHHSDVLEGYKAWTKPGGLCIIKYCLEIYGRDQLVEDNFVSRFFENPEWNILYQEEKKELASSKATFVSEGEADSAVRTGTMIAVRNNL